MARPIWSLELIEIELGNSELRVLGIVGELELRVLRIGGGVWSGLGVMGLGIFVSDLTQTIKKEC